MLDGTRPDCVPAFLVARFEDPAYCFLFELPLKVLRTFEVLLHNG
jgi:hypothetical protein